MGGKGRHDSRSSHGEFHVSSGEHNPLFTIASYVNVVQTYTFKPNQRLTFLCGENGSGKSAVLSAIVFGLGKTAKQVGRGTANSDFIRTGEKSTTVEIKLLNRGEDAW